MEKTLDLLKSGEKGIVKNIVVKGRVRQRLLDMGVTPNASVTFKKKAPLGDPIEINIRGYVLSLRKEEAKDVILEVEECDLP